MPVRRLALLFLPLLVSRCSTHHVGEENLHSVLWTQTSGEYRALARQSYFVATQMLESALADPDWTAALEQGPEPGGLPPAVILDIDETVLDNSSFQAGLILDEGLYDGDAWQEWCRQERAPAVPGAVDFTRFARQKGVAVFYVTNRSHAVEDVTRANLAKMGFPLGAPGDSDRVLTRGEGGDNSGDKTARRQKIAAQYRVLLLVGDNLDDFLSLGTASPEKRRAAVAQYASRWGRQWIVLPNPQYGSWEGALFGFNYGLPEKDKIEIEKRALKP